MLMPVATTAAERRLSRHESRALMVRHAAAMRVIRHCKTPEERISLLAAVIAPERRELREM